MIGMEMAPVVLGSGIDEIEVMTTMNPTAEELDATTVIMLVTIRVDEDAVEATAETPEMADVAGTEMTAMTAMTVDAVEVVEVDNRGEDAKELVDEETVTTTTAREGLASDL